LGTLLVRLATSATATFCAGLLLATIAAINALLVLIVASTALGSGPLLATIAAINTLLVLVVASTALGSGPLLATIAAINTLLVLIVASTALRRSLLRSRGARRIITQAALLARTERTRRGYVPLRPDLGARLPNCHLRTEALTTAQVLFADHDCTPNPGGADQHARLNLVGAQWPADRGRNVGCRDPRVHGKVRSAITDDHGAIDHHGFTEEDRIFTFRHDH
jgi:hypothetical protein